MQSVSFTKGKHDYSSQRKIDALISMGAGDLVNNTLRKLISYQKSRYKSYIEQLNLDLRRFEKTYNMSSSQFYKDFEDGLLGDSADYFEWSSLYENLLLFQKRVEELESLDKI